MLRLTGPGKIRSLEVSPVLNAATTSITLLYNFDVDGDSVKPQHRDWLKDHVAPQLGVPGVQISVRGEASRTGNEDYNEALSRRRVNNVLNFLSGFGSVATITTNQPGEVDAEQAGEKDGVEDEQFRAVKITIINSAPRLVPPTFAFGGLGLDNVVANPPWLMLPAGAAFRFVQIDNAQGLTLVSSNPGIVRVRSLSSNADASVVVTQQREIFRVFPGVTADATISAVDRAGVTVAKLAVSVLTQKTVNCAFHYVQNARYGTRKRHLGDEAAFVDKLNEIWGPQANVRFVLTSAGDLPLTEDLGDSIDTLPKFDKIFGHRLKNVQFNVFFVREVQAPASENDDDLGVTKVGDHGSCVFEDAKDDGGVDTLALCHEAGHCLTLDHDTPIPTRNNMLMFRTKDGFGPFLPKAHVLKARQAVKG